MRWPIARSSLVGPRFIAVVSFCFTLNARCSPASQLNSHCKPCQWINIVDEKIWSIHAGALPDGTSNENPKANSRGRFTRQNREHASGIAPMVMECPHLARLQRPADYVRQAIQAVLFPNSVRS